MNDKLINVYEIFIDRRSLLVFFSPTRHHSKAGCIKINFIIHTTSWDLLKPLIFPKNHLKICGNIRLFTWFYGIVNDNKSRFNANDHVLINLNL